MDSFIVSARKYRPDTFASVVGQISVTQTLKNAIKNKHIAQAYLFCGPRGVGKTTCARIFAKTINCQNLSSDFEACNECESCKSFNQGRSLNIHELDAASNNSVDDIRNIIDKVRIPPQLGKYSVYIIDEVHMLSQQAFNAFLKTLEEPPSYAIFILATTEKHKILPTILSRCQIYDFNRIKIDDIVDYLEKIAQNENISYEREGLYIIAQKAEGGMRDALSLFDQIVNFSEGKITYQNVIQNLSILDYDYYFKLIDFFQKGDVASALLIFNEILDKGFDAQHFLTGLGSHLRDLLVCKDISTLNLLEKGDQAKELYKKQAQSCSYEFIFNALSIINNFDTSFKTSNNKRLHVEIALIKLSNICEELKKKIELPALTVTKETTSLNDKPVSESKNNTYINNKSSEKDINNDDVNETKVHETSGEYASSDSISIKNTLKNIKTTKKTENKIDTPVPLGKKNDDKNFTIEELENYWNIFASKFKEEKPRLYTTLVSAKPILNNGTKIVFQVLNDLQYEAVMEEKNALLAFLSTKLENSNLELEISISSPEDKKHLYYTVEDKFKRMCEKNPNLRILKQKLNLDIE
jgi:DNA polymerase-3 subunit gamma/tau